MCGGGGRPQLALARSDRFVRVLCALLVELPETVRPYRQRVTVMRELAVGGWRNSSRGAATADPGALSLSTEATLGRANGGLFIQGWCGRVVQA